MKRITLILFASMLTLGGFAQTKEFKDVYVTFTNQLQPDDTYMVINSNYPGSGLFIEYEWFIDSPNYTRVLYGQVE